MDVKSDDPRRKRQFAAQVRDAITGPKSDVGLVDPL